MAVAIAALSINAGAAKENYLGGASCEIKLENNPRRELAPEFVKEICGNIIISAPAPVAYSNMWIQLEGTAIARFKTKFDGFITNNYIHEYVLSPQEFSFYAIGHEDHSKCTRRPIKPGVHYFPFKINLQEVIYPMAFKSPFGQVQYRLAVYVGQNMGDERKISAAHLNLSCKGYRNLGGEEDLLQPVQVVRSKEKTFSRRLISKATFSLEKQAFVRGESIKFSLVIENPVCENINKVYVELILKTIYHGSQLKTTSVVLRRLDKGHTTADPEIFWSGDLLVPSNAMPTFSTANKCLDILYYVQFVIEVNKRPNLKGETVVYIGTTDGTNKPPESHVMLAVDAADGGNISLPPVYSALSSRRPSTEILPPPYEDVIDIDPDPGHGNAFEHHRSEPNGFRPRSSSNVM